LEGFSVSPATYSFATKYVGLAGNVASIMRRLKSPMGGVCPGHVYVNNTFDVGYDLSFTSGETTSLFVLADTFM
jgi:hypothetical protein